MERREQVRKKIKEDLARERLNKGNNVTPQEPEPGAIRLALDLSSSSIDAPFQRAFVQLAAPNPSTPDESFSVITSSFIGEPKPCSLKRKPFKTSPEFAHTRNDVQTNRLAGPRSSKPRSSPHVLRSPASEFWTSEAKLQYKLRASQPVPPLVHPPPDYPPPDPPADKSSNLYIFRGRIFILESGDGPPSIIVLRRFTAPNLDG